MQDFSAATIELTLSFGLVIFTMTCCLSMPRSFCLRWPSRVMSWCIKAFGLKCMVANASSAFFMPLCVTASKTSLLFGLPRCHLLCIFLFWNSTPLKFASQWHGVYLHGEFLPVVKLLSCVCTISWRLAMPNAFSPLCHTNKATALSNVS